MKISRKLRELKFLRCTSPSDHNVSHFSTYIVYLQNIPFLNNQTFDGVQFTEY